VHAADVLPAPAEMGVARVTVDLMRAVPTAELGVDARVVREGRKLQLIDVEVCAGATLVARGSVLRIRREDQPDVADGPGLALPGPEAGVRTHAPSRVGFSRLFDMRAVSGSFEALGPSAIWFRMNAPLVSEQKVSPFAGAVACADFANGIANVVPFEDWSYPSTDLSVSFTREPVGPAILVDAECWAAGEGRGITHARLGDQQGWFGRSIQTTIFERRR
jgi:acyl-coenzyme A thioesterase PaaI-like protein